MKPDFAFRPYLEELEQRNLPSVMHGDLAALQPHADTQSQMAHIAVTQSVTQKMEVTMGNTSKENKEHKEDCACCLKVDRLVDEGKITAKEGDEMKQKCREEEERNHEAGEIAVELEKFKAELEEQMKKAAEKLAEGAEKPETEAAELPELPEPPEKEKAERPEFHTPEYEEEEGEAGEGKDLSEKEVKKVLERIEKIVHSDKFAKAVQEGKPDNLPPAFWKDVEKLLHFNGKELEDICSPKIMEFLKKEKEKAAVERYFQSQNSGGEMSDMTESARINAAFGRDNVSPTDLMAQSLAVVAILNAGMISTRSDIKEQMKKIPVC